MTEHIELFFSKNRITWLQFYESERVIISRLGLNLNSTILDIGCGCGGLGLALKDEFKVSQYTGVEINSLAAETAKRLNSRAQIYCGDFLSLSKGVLSNKQFDAVFSLSCFDWNIQFDTMLTAAWEHVLPGGALIATFRLVSTEGCNDINKSFQFINFDNEMEGECAAYVVLNANELMSKISVLRPSEISAFGYFGSPSFTAVTPYEKLCFSAFLIRKKNDDDMVGVLFDVNLPEEINSSLVL